MSDKINDLLIALQHAEAALDVCKPGASKAQILSRAIIARAATKDALRKFEWLISHLTAADALAEAVELYTDDRDYSLPSAVLDALRQYREAK